MDAAVVTSFTEFDARVRHVAVAEPGSFWGLSRE